MRLRRDAPRPNGRSHDADTLAVFAVLWALAACWHLVGNPDRAPRWSELLVVVGVAVVLYRPGAVLPLVGLSVGSLVLLWQEAPVLGNHWLLVGVVDVAILASCAVSALRRRLTDRIDLADRLFPAIRLCVVLFYGFVGFAKLNSAFADRAVSCAPLFFRESTSSVGLAWLQFGGAGWVDALVIVGTAGTELLLPVLLVQRRTRSYAVIGGLVFHLALAVDQTHQFYDFSSVMFALLVLFLPHSFGSWVGERVGSIRARLALRGPRLPVVARVVGVGVPVALVLVVIGDVTDARGSLLVGWWPWQVAGVLIVGAVIRYVRQRPPAYGSGWRIWPHHVAYLVVPLLLVGNGLTPYLELKTAFGWNMYSNLRTVGGESNHLLLGRSFPVLGEQDELVEIIRSSSADLESYAEAGYGLPYLQLRSYLADHPDESITYERGGERITLRRASDRPELVEPVPVWQRKFQVFRAVDLTSPERCVPVFGPAR